VNRPRRSLIVGASAGVGRALAEVLARRGHALFLVASDPSDLDATASDLRLRHGAEVWRASVDLRHPDIGSLRRQVSSTIGEIDNLLLVAGAFRDDDDGTLDPDAVDELVAVNFSSVVKVIHAFLPDLARSPVGNIVGIGSIAAGRARSRSMVYAASKRALEFYFEAVRHRTGTGRPRVQFYRLGYVDTAMSYGRKTPLPKASAAAAARAIARNMDRDLGVGYFPRWWAPIVLALRCVPWSLYRRLNF